MLPLLDDSPSFAFIWYPEVESLFATRPPELESKTTSQFMEERSEQ